MHRTNSTRLFIAPTSCDVNSAASSGTEDQKAKILWVTGPGVAAESFAVMCELLKRTKLPHIIYGDGASAISREKIQSLIRDSLTGDAHIFFNCHGNASNGKHYFQIGAETAGNPDDYVLFTDELPDFLTDEKANQSAHSDHKKTFHIASCHAGAMREMIKPGSERWNKSYMVLYASKKAAIDDSLTASLKASLDYIDTCRSRCVDAYPFDLFLHVTNVQSDCITVLGGQLCAPLISHAPKSADTLAGEKKSRWHGHHNDIALINHRLTEKSAELNAADKTSQLHHILFTRVDREDHDSVDRLLKTNPELINIRNIHAETPLMQAIYRSDLAMVKILLAHGASLSCKDKDGENTLFAAVNMGQKMIAALLLQHGAAQFINEQDNDGNTALMIAAKYGRDELVALLLDAGAQTDVTNNKIHSAYSLAAKYENTRCAELIARKIKADYRASIAIQHSKAPEKQKT